VGGVLEPYDTDKLYPVYGFGAKVRAVLYCVVCCNRGVLCVLLFCCNLTARVS
jgi:hypothetical protein